MEISNQLENSIKIIPSEDTSFQENIKTESCLSP
jgi:hypothetical protein